nr:MAG TPA: hypothetical protein [Caudoviricetes sp.]
MICRSHTYSYPVLFKLKKNIFPWLRFKFFRSL